MVESRLRVFCRDLILTYGKDMCDMMFRNGAGGTGGVDTIAVNIELRLYLSGLLVWLTFPGKASLELWHRYFSRTFWTGLVRCCCVVENSSASCTLRWVAHFQCFYSASSGRSASPLSIDIARCSMNLTESLHSRLWRNSPIIFGVWRCARGK